MEIVLVLVVGILMLLSFLLGVNVTQKIQRNEKVEVPNPIKSVRKGITEKERKERLDRLENEYITNMDNIDNYDGSSAGQKDF